MSQPIGDDDTEFFEQGSPKGVSYLYRGQEMARNRAEGKQL